MKVKGLAKLLSRRMIKGSSAALVITFGPSRSYFACAMSMARPSGWYGTFYRRSLPNELRQRSRTVQVLPRWSELSLFGLSLFELCAS